MEERRDFWMLYAEGTSAPAKKHDTFAEALTEARRIAEKQGCARVFLLHSEAVLERPVPEAALHYLPNASISRE